MSTIMREPDDVPIKLEDADDEHTDRKPGTITPIDHTQTLTGLCTSQRIVCPSVIGLPYRPSGGEDGPRLKIASTALKYGFTFPLTESQSSSQRAEQSISSDRQEDDIRTLGIKAAEYFFWRYQPGSRGQRSISSMLDPDNVGSVFLWTDDGPEPTRLVVSVPFKPSNKDPMGYTWQTMDKLDPHHRDFLHSIYPTLLSDVPLKNPKWPTTPSQAVVHFDHSTRDDQTSLPVIPRVVLQPVGSRSTRCQYLAKYDGDKFTAMREDGDRQLSYMERSRHHVQRTIDPQSTDLAPCRAYYGFSTPPTETQGRTWVLPLLYRPGALPNLPNDLRWLTEDEVKNCSTTDGVPIEGLDTVVDMANSHSPWFDRR